MLSDREVAVGLRLLGLTHRQIGRLLGIPVQKYLAPSKDAVRELKEKLRSKGNLKLICEICERLPGMHAHHINSEAVAICDYNRADNLVWICPKCHRLIHIRH